MRIEEDEDMIMDPFFSVIIPAYNSAEFIRKGLESIRTQDFKNYELIVVCDSCTDSTKEVALAYTDIVLSTNCNSAGGSRNAGLDVARGEWILFMDDDDWYLPGAFRKLAEELEKQKDVDILAFGFEWKTRGIAMQTPVRVYPAVWNKAWRRSFIGDERFPTWANTEDLCFARKLHPKAKMGYLLDLLYHYEFMRPGCVSEKIKNGEYDNRLLPDEFRQAADGYENWLKGVT